MADHNLRFRAKMSGLYYREYGIFLNLLLATTFELFSFFKTDQHHHREQGSRTQMLWRYTLWRTEPILIVCGTHSKVTLYLLILKAVKSIKRSYWRAVCSPRTACLKPLIFEFVYLGVRVLERKRKNIYIFLHTHTYLYSIGGHNLVFTPYPISEERGLAMWVIFLS